MGPTRRVILWDTLLEPRSTPRGAHGDRARARAPLPRPPRGSSTAWYVLVALPLALLVAVVARRRGGMYEPRAVPLALFVAVALQIVVSPAQNVVTRRYEAEADWVALQTSRDPAAAR